MTGFTQDEFLQLIAYFLELLAQLLDVHLQFTPTGRYQLTKVRLCVLGHLTTSTDGPLARAWFPPCQRPQRRDRRLLLQPSFFAEGGEGAAEVDVVFLFAAPEPSVSPLVVIELFQDPVCVRERVVGLVGLAARA